MKQSEIDLIRALCYGESSKAQKLVRIVLQEMTAKKDIPFRDSMLRKLDSKGATLLELPTNLKELLVAEDVSDFPTSRFLLRGGEKFLVDKIEKALKVADKLNERGISYRPAAILYGKSGGGKTMLARYIAYKTGRPFVYMKFSTIVNSYLGKTQNNISKVFDYARESPCVLCLDELDAIGMARGQHEEVGEMNRIVITLMQELDRIQNNVVVIATTNRFDRLDEALIRRFPFKHEVTLLNEEEIIRLAEKFFRYSGYTVGWVPDWSRRTIINVNSFNKEPTLLPASEVIRICTEKLVDMMEKEVDKK